jgi:hypothetical protein
MNRNSAGVGSKYKSFYTNNIAYVEQFLKYRIVEGFIFRGANFIAFNIDLYPACSGPVFLQKRHCP